MKSPISKPANPTATSRATATQQRIHQFFNQMRMPQRERRSRAKPALSLPALSFPAVSLPALSLYKRIPKYLRYQYRHPPLPRKKMFTRQSSKPKKNA